jgi:CBS domain-containing protein
MKKCNEVMTKNLVCCLPSDAVSKVAELWRARISVRIPIIESEQTTKLVGIVTDRDLALKIVADVRDPRSTKAEELMTREVVTCRAEDDLQNALDAMSGHKLRRIPVIVTTTGLRGLSPGRMWRLVLTSLKRPPQWLEEFRYRITANESGVY